MKIFFQHKLYIFGRLIEYLKLIWQTTHFCIPSFTSLAVINYYLNKITFFHFATLLRLILKCKAI